MFLGNEFLPQTKISQNLYLLFCPLKAEPHHRAYLIFATIKIQSIFWDFANQVELPEGVIVDSLNKIAAENPEFIGKYYAKIAKTDEDGITALNTFLAQDGLLIYVPKNVKVERTIQVINILRSDVDLMVNRRVLIVMEQGAEAKFLFCDHAADDKNFLATQVIEEIGRASWRERV